MNSPSKSDEQEVPAWKQDLPPDTKSQYVAGWHLEEIRDPRLSVQRITESAIGYFIAYLLWQGIELGLRWLLEVVFHGG